MDDLIREMIAENRRPAIDKSRRGRLIATTLTVGLASIGITSLTTGALFTDTETMSATDFTTGTVVIEPTMSATVALGALNMAPGDTSYGAVLVRNAGSLEQRYAVSLAATDGQATPLTGELDLTVYAGGAEAACSAAGIAALTTVATSTGLPTALTPLIGSSDPGADGGDRLLGALTDEVLCVVVHLPVETGNAFQGTTAQLALTFDAEQTANNA